MEDANRGLKMLVEKHHLKLVEDAKKAKEWKLEKEGSSSKGGGSRRESVGIVLSRNLMPQPYLFLRIGSTPSIW
jgi:hypothetical protein